MMTERKEMWRKREKTKERQNQRKKETKDQRKTYQNRSKENTSDIDRTKYLSSPVPESRVQTEGPVGIAKRARHRITSDATYVDGTEAR